MSKDPSQKGEDQVVELVPAGEPLSNQLQGVSPPASLKARPQAGYAIYIDEAGDVKFDELGPSNSLPVVLGLHEMAGVTIRDRMARAMRTLSALTIEKIAALVTLFSKN